MLQLANSTCLARRLISKCPKTSLLNRVLCEVFILIRNKRISSKQCFAFGPSLNFSVFNITWLLRLIDNYSHNFYVTLVT